MFINIIKPEIMRWLCRTITKKQHQQMNVSRGAHWFAHILFMPIADWYLCAIASAVHDKRERQKKRQQRGSTWLVILIHKESCLAATIVHHNALIHNVPHTCNIHANANMYYAYAGKGGKTKQNGRLHSVCFMSHTYSFNIHNEIIEIWLHAYD